MEIGRIPTPPLLISEEEQWNLFLEEDPDFDLSMFFSQALEMMDQEEKEQKESEVEKGRQEEEEEVEEEKEIAEPIKEKATSGENAALGGVNHAQAGACNNIENVSGDVVSSKFSEELKREMAAFLRTLDPRQGPADLILNLSPFFSSRL